MFRTMTASAILLSLVSSAVAHDSWVQTNINVMRAGDAMHIDLMLGNHGNDHRDFKLASKIDLDGCKLKVHDPQGKSYDIVDRLTDTGYAPKEGFWTTKFAATVPGLYTVEHTLDKVVNHGKPVRSIRSAKTCFVVSKLLDKVPFENPGFDKPLGHAFELVPAANPVTPMGPGETIKVRLLFKGKPLADTRVSFIPRGETLAAGFDDRYERMTDADGMASVVATTGNYFLVVAHRTAPDERGTGYEATQYAATLTVFVPEVCCCCGE